MDLKLLLFSNVLAALDEGAHYDMDDKLLSLLYTSTNGLIDIASSDLYPYEENWSSNICFDTEDGVSRSGAHKRKFSNGSIFTSVHDTSAELNKKRRVD